VTDHAAILVRALQAGIERDGATLAELCTDDVKGWTPTRATDSLAELVAQLDATDPAFSEFELDVFPLAVQGDHACVEWQASMTHSGDIEVAAGKVVAATGLRLTVNGVTIAEFDGDRICSFRQYWNELSVYEQIGLVGD
jgi:ketosteroid isomerase-like protein